MVGLSVSANMMAGYLNYGVAIMNENDAERAAIEAFMEQSAMDSGETFGERLKKNFLIYNLEFETQGNQTILVFQGFGRYGVDEDSFLDYGSKTVETQFAFVKDSSGNYQLAAAILGDTQLSERKMNYYWKNIIQ